MRRASRAAATVDFPEPGGPATTQAGAAVGRFHAPRVGPQSGRGAYPPRVRGRRPRAVRRELSGEVTGGPRGPQRVRHRAGAGSGKSAVVLGLAEVLSRRAGRLGYFRPLIGSGIGSRRRRRARDRAVPSRPELPGVVRAQRGRPARRRRRGAYGDLLKRVLDGYRGVADGATSRQQPAPDGEAAPSAVADAAVTAATTGPPDVVIVEGSDFTGGVARGGARPQRRLGQPPRRPGTARRQRGPADGRAGARPGRPGHHHAARTGLHADRRRGQPREPQRPGRGARRVARGVG